MSTIRSLRNRSSRYSSPATFTDSQTVAKSASNQQTTNGGQTNLDAWVEPVVRNGVPSFEDTKGLERVGVLEHMAPLGMPPSQKLLQKLKVNINRHSTRATPVNAEDVTPPNESVKHEQAFLSTVEPLPETVKLEEPVIISSPPRGRPAKKELDEMRQIVDTATPSPMKSSFQSVQASPRPQSIQEIIRQDRMKTVFDRAISEASNQADPSLIPGLQQLFDDARSKPQLWTVLDSVLNRTPTDAQFRIFKRYIKRGIRHYRKYPSSFSNSPRSFNYASPPQAQTVAFLQTFPNSNIPTAPLSSKPRPVQSPFRFKPVHTNSISPTVESPMSPTSKLAPEYMETESQTSHKRKRSRSISSSSSLSSAKSLPEDFSSEAVDVDAEGQAAERRPVRSTGPRQAIARVAAGSRTRPSGVPQPEPSQPYSGFPTTIKFVSKNHSNKRKEETAHESEQFEARRREFQREILTDYNNIPRTESSERTIIHDKPLSEDRSVTQTPAPVIHPHSLSLPNTTVLSPTGSQARPELSPINGTSRKRIFAEMDENDLDVITPLSPSPPPVFPSPATAANTTRGATPRTTRLPPAAPISKARKSARVMISPNKPKNGGITAGISRAGPGRDVGIGNGADSGPEDNDEFCASCGGEGTLLCCDGCTNSFHHGCLEPPLNPDDEVEGEWFCPRCIARRNKETSPATGLMGQIIRRVDHTIPKAYTLPLEIRDYFEGVKTGDEGEYEEIGLARTQNPGVKMNRAGFFEEPSYKELRDNKGNFILCYRCGNASGGRDIVPCDYCPAKWHTDCIDPPLAVPPRRRGGDKPTGYWRCPLHIDGDLTEIGRQVESAPGDLGRIPRLRKPKKAIPVDIDLSRGFKNNGIIEVSLMKDEMPDIKEVALEGGIYRLPERGIRLDFIDRVKKSWYEDQVFPSEFDAQPRIRRRLYRPDDPILHHPAAYTIVKHKEPEFVKGARAISVAETARANVQLRQKSFKEQSAIMSLLGLSSQVSDNYSLDPLADLTSALIAEAPDEVEADMNNSEREMLLRLQKLVNSRLTVLGDGDGDQRRDKKVGGHKASKPRQRSLDGDVDEQDQQLNGYGAVDGEVENNGNGQDDGDDEAGADADHDADRSTAMDFES